MNKALVAYFSATGVTKDVAQRLAMAVDADLFAIEPQEPYSMADLDWTNKASRSTVEMNDPSSRPAMATSAPDLSGYDTVFLGFPVWWYTAPHIIDTFVESCDLAGKVIVPFCTSGSSGYGRSSAAISKEAPNAIWLPGTRLDANISSDGLQRWVEGLNL